MIKPNARFDKATDISIKFLKENGIKAFILDVDNTLIDLNKREIADITTWVTGLKEDGIKLCICSNSLKKTIISNLAKKWDIPFIYFSLKPTKIGLSKAVKALKDKYGLEKMSEIAEVGDQLFTDCFGANRMGMFSILTKPYELETSLVSRIKRKQEKKYLDKVYKGEEDVR